MLRKKGIVRKTFLFSALLIVLVTLVSFAVLYFAMPRFYLNKKGQTFQKNLDVLISELKAAENQDEYAEIISDFSRENNANVLSFDSQGMMLPTVSTPFVSIKGGGGNAYFTVIQEEGGKERTTYSVITRQRTNNTSENTSGGIHIVNSEEPAVVGIKSFISRSDNVMSLRGEIGSPIVDYIMVSGTLQPIDEAKDVILSLIPYVLFIGIILGLLLAWVYARQISKPILQISQAAEKMQLMEPNADSGIRSNDELGLLSRNLDTLYASLCQNIESLRGEMDKANRLERSKTEMMRSASHELKTPIAALNGMIEGMLDNVGVYKDKEKYLLECKGQTDRLAALVEEILSASKSDIFEDKLNIEEVSVDELTMRAFKEYDVQIRENGLDVAVSLSPIIIKTDRSVLYRTISNIVSNAVRYADSGGDLRAVLIDDGTDRVLTVENQCAPIPEDELNKLFEPFYTRSYSRNRAKNGTGLGLYIVKRNLERLGIACAAENGDIGFKISLKL